MRILLRLVFCVPLFIVSLVNSSQSAQILVNPNYEAVPDHQLGWLKGPPVSILDYVANAAPSWNPGPTPVPVESGPWGPQLVVNGTLTQSNVRQNVPVAPGKYRVDASGWARVFDNGTDFNLFSSATLQLRVDDVPVDEVVLINDGSHPTDDWTPWTLLQIPTQIVEPTTSIGIRFIMRADAQDGTWAQVNGDLFSLNAVLIPEPASLSCFFVGLLALACNRRIAGRLRQ